MRFKKQKRHRKAVRFYTACYGFREPFKVLCDGTFVHHLLSKQITPADTAVSNALGAPVKLFTTRCVLAELKSLGEAYFETFKAASDLFIARCDHEKRKSAVDCVEEIIGENNPEHFFVASQDFNLREKFRKIPGVPLMYGLHKALLLEPPSAIQCQVAKATEEKRLHMSELELKMLGMKKKNVSATEEATESFDVNETEGHQVSGCRADTKIKYGRKRLEVKDKAQFKRNKPKAPNPLSCKKKKKKELRPNSDLAKDSNDTESVRSRNRKRKRSRGAKKVEEANS